MEPVAPVAAAPRPRPAPHQDIRPTKHQLSPTVLARRQPIDMELPGEASPRHLAGQPKARRRTSWRRYAIRGAAVAVVLVVTIGGLLFSQSYFKVQKVFKGGAGTAAALNNNVKPELLKGEGRGRVNILMLGRGGAGHDAPDLTDTIMVASVDPVNKTATLLSLPRDLWVNVPGRGVMKLNGAWQSGATAYLGRLTTGTNDPQAIAAGYKTINDTLKEVLGIEIDYNILVNFQAFKQAVDTVGGVDINVPADLIDPTMAWENKNDPALARAGPQVMDGAKALMYARSRETSSDFARGERQRALLMALKSKVVNLGTLSNPAKLSGLINAFGNNVQTNLSLKNAQRLHGIVKGVNDNKVNSISLADITNPLVTTGNVVGQSVVLPKAGLFKYGDIHQYVRAQLKDPYILKEKAKILVLNGTATPGLATTKANELMSYGYNVIRAGNTPNSGWTQTTVIDLARKHKYTRNYLEKRFNQVAANRLSDTSIPTDYADFVIIIGSNEGGLTTNQAN